MAELSLVTGAAGFIGGRLQSHLREHGCEVVGWARSLGDLRDTTAVRSVLADYKPSRIFHLAAGSDWSNESWTTIAENQRMLGNLIYGMPDHCQLIYTGSMAEYGRAGIFDETDQCLPDTAYGCAKYLGTTSALVLRAMLGRDVRVARLFGVYGAGEGASRLLPALVQKLSRGEPVPLSDGLQIRDFVHVSDVSAALLAFAAADDPPAIVNLGTGIGITVREVCEIVAANLGADPSLLRFGEIPRRAVDQDCLVARVARLTKFIEPPIQRWKVPELAAENVSEFMAGAGSPDAARHFGG